MLEHANIRMDFFKWANVPEDGNHKIKLRPNSFLNAQLQYLLPNSLRWVGDMFLASLFDREAMLRESTEHLKECIIANVGHYTFQEAFDRTGRIINITVAPSNNYDPPRLLNYLTAPHVCVWSAAMASCAIPGVFESIQLYVKEPNGEYRPEHMWTLQGSGCGSKSKKGSKDVRPMSELVQEPNIENAVYTDGSIENDLPMQQISELFNVNHFIVSQVNPHSSILSSLAVRATVWSSSFLGASVSYLRFLKAQLRDWLNNVIELVVSRSLNPSWNARRGVVQLMTQVCGVSICIGV